MTFLRHFKSLFRAVLQSKILSLTMVQFYGGRSFEWCQDWHGDYSKGSTTDPTGAASGSLRVSRGGCWYDYSVRCRSAYRYRYAPDYRSFNLGFRVLRSSVK